MESATLGYPEGRINLPYTWGRADSAFRNKNNVLSPISEEFLLPTEQLSIATENTDSDTEETKCITEITDLSESSGTELEMSCMHPNTAPLAKPFQNAVVYHEPANIDPGVTENVLMLTGKLLGMAKEMYEIVDGQFAKANDALDFRRAFCTRIDTPEDIQMLIQKPADVQIVLATSAVRMAENRLALAKSGLGIIEERLYLARRQVELCEKRVEMEKESLLVAKKMAAHDSMRSDL